MSWFSKLFAPKKAKKLKKTAPLDAKDRQYLAFKEEKKKKALHRKGKRFTSKDRRALIKEIKEDRYQHQTAEAGRSSGWGFIEYYLLFNWINQPSHYHSQDFVDSPSYDSNPDDSFNGGGGESGGGGASGDWSDDSSSDSSDSNDSSSSDSCDSSSSDSYDSGSSCDSGGGSSD